MLSLDLGITSNGAKAYYECNKLGYTINGSGFVTCDLDGQWKPLPECQSMCRTVAINLAIKSSLDQFILFTFQSLAGLSSRRYEHELPSYFDQ